MKREQIINKIYDKIRDDLLHAKLLYWEEDDCNKYPLVDHLSSGDDISTGRDEVDNIIEQIEIEDLIDTILALPILGLDNPYPLCIVLEKLKWATNYLLHTKNYDGHEYEELNQCVHRAEEIISCIEESYTDKNETSKAMKDKLAEEILVKYFEPCGIDDNEREDLQLAITLNPSLDRIIKAMQAYHEAKMKEVTDDDIKKWALYDREYLIDYEVSTSSELNQRLRGREEGAKAMRDGEIVSSNRDDKIIKKRTDNEAGL